MRLHEIEPMDRFAVQTIRPLTMTDQQIIVSLYQPLIGIEATSLYLSLFTFHERDVQWTKTHYYLMNFYGVSLEKIFEWRITLEAIGLMMAYERKEAEGRSFLYVMQPPVAPATFFEDPLLSTFLLSRVGENGYRELRDQFVLKRPPLDTFTNVTRTFTDVFTPMSQKDSPPLEEDDMLERYEQVRPLTIPLKQFDFQLMRDSLSKQLFSERQFERLSKSLIARLSFLYDLSPIEMSDVVLIAMNQYGEDFTDEQLRKAAVEFYKLNRSTTVPTLVPKYEGSDPSTTEKPSEQETIVQYFERVSPRELLIDLSGGKEPTLTTLKLADDLMNVHEFPAPIINVLFHYLHLQNNGKITRGFAETIATQWANKGVKTVKDAMLLSKQEKEQFEKSKEEKKKRKTPFYRQPTRVEKLPEWFSEEESKEEEEKRTEDEHVVDPEIEERKRRLKERFGIQENGGEADETD